MKDLNVLYHACLNNYIVTGKREHPSHLLAMLLLPEKDKFEPLRVSEGNFYEYYKEQIDNKINQIMKDFQMYEEDIIEYVEEKGVCCDDYENDKIWFVFAEGFGVLHGEIMYRPNQTPEEMYFRCFELPEFMQHKKVKEKL